MAEWLLGVERWLNRFPMIVIMISSFWQGHSWLLPQGCESTMPLGTNLVLSTYGELFTESSSLIGFRDMVKGGA